MEDVSPTPLGVNEGCKVGSSGVPGFSGVLVSWSAADISNPGCCDKPEALKEGKLMFAVERHAAWLDERHRRSIASQAQGFDL